MGLFVFMKLDAIIKKFNVIPDQTTESWKVHRIFFKSVGIEGQNSQF